jgi:hypothetical protein
MSVRQKVRTTEPLTRDHARFYSEISERLDEMAEVIEKLPAPRLNSDYWLPIDGFLELLAARHVSPTLVNPERFRVFGSVNCWIRGFLGTTFRFVANKDPLDREKACKKAQALLSDSLTFSQHLATFLRKHPPRSSYGLMLHDGQSQEMKGAIFLFMEALEERLKQLENDVHIVIGCVGECLDEIAPIQGGRPAQKWKRFFVGAMAQAWWLLTGSTPPPNHHSLIASLPNL